MKSIFISACLILLNFSAVSCQNVRESESGNNGFGQCFIETLGGYAGGASALAVAFNTFDEPDDDVKMIFAWQGIVLGVNLVGKLVNMKKWNFLYTEIGAGIGAIVTVVLFEAIAPGNIENISIPVISALLIPVAAVKGYNSGANAKKISDVGNLNSNYHFFLQETACKNYFTFVRISF